MFSKPFIVFVITVLKGNNKIATKHNFNLGEYLHFVLFFPPPLVLALLTLFVAFELARNRERGNVMTYSYETRTRLRLQAMFSLN